MSQRRVVLSFLASRGGSVMRLRITAGIVPGEWVVIDDDDGHDDVGKLVAFGFMSEVDAQAYIVELTAKALRSESTKRGHHDDDGLRHRPGA
jgi:hypothetical protein